jgi:hypothetical protein
MKTNDVVVGGQYFATISGARARVTVLQRTENLTRTWDVHGGVKLVVKFRCMNMYTGREVFKSARQLVPAPALKPLSAEQAMDALVSIADGSMPADHVKVAAEAVIAACPAVVPSKPAVVGYTDDGLPLTAAAAPKWSSHEPECPAHGALCHGAWCRARHNHRVYNEAMARS